MRHNLILEGNGIQFHQIQSRLTNPHEYPGPYCQPLRYRVVRIYGGAELTLPKSEFCNVITDGTRKSAEDNESRGRVRMTKKFLTVLEEPELFSSKEIPDRICLLLFSSPEEFLLLLSALVLVSPQVPLFASLLLLLIFFESWTCSPSGEEEEEAEEANVEGAEENVKNPLAIKAFLTAFLMGRARLLPPTRTTSFISFRSSLVQSLSPLFSYL